MQPPPSSADEPTLALLLSLLPPSPTPRPRPRPSLTVILNPRAGAHAAESHWRVAAALLRARGVLRPSSSGEEEEERVLRTGGAGDGARLGRGLRGRWDAREGERDEGREVLVVLGGDGTVHEVLNGLLLDGEGEGEGEALWGGAARVEVVLIPAGTANALYHHLFPPESASYPPSSPAAPFYSLLSFLRSLSPSSSPSPSSPHPPPTLLPLPLALNTLPAPCPRKTLTTVVSSAALHAALLHDAEALRATHPGTERFKLAAAQNVDRWWDGEVRLRGGARRYDPATRAWVPLLGSASDGESPVTVRGPFAYLVCALTSRFEPTFVVAPFRSPLSPLAPDPDAEADAEGGGGPTVDIVAVRSLRHGPTRALERAGEGERARKGFVERVWAVTRGMYDGGRHVESVYAPGEAAEVEEGEDADGGAVCEVWRAADVEWVPDAREDDLKSRLVCLDGALHDLGTKGGTLRVRAVGGADSAVRVWA